jgi:hypothetical protein
MVEVLLAMGLPTVVFGVFALLSLWFGAESRPWFDERPVLDERPNWWPVRRSAPADEDEDDDEDEEPPDGTPAPAPDPPRAQPRPAAVATRAATSPSGV